MHVSSKKEWNIYTCESTVTLIRLRETKQKKSTYYLSPYSRKCQIIYTDHLQNCTALKWALKAEWFINKPSSTTTAPTSIWLWALANWMVYRISFKLCIKRSLNRKIKIYMIPWEATARVAPHQKAYHFCRAGQLKVYQNIREDKQKNNTNSYFNFLIGPLTNPLKKAISC